jgi:hypothetical protein
VLAKLDWRDGHVNCGLADDTLWYKADESGHDFAVVKLSFNLNHKAQNRSRKVECYVNFSMESEEHFQGVHRCWPALVGIPNTQQVSEGLDVDPNVDGGGVSASVAKAYKNKEKTRQSN